MATHDRSDRDRAALRLALVTCAALATGVATAQTPTDGTRLGVGSRVVELFTSQGCPKCPPANRLIADLAHEPGTVAVSYAVNTWDFSGWRDTLASPSFTERQAAYAAARGDRRIFTPQAIVDGVAAEPGADRAAILRDAAAHDGAAMHGDAMQVPLDISEGDGTLHIQLGAAGAAGTQGVVQAGVYVLRVLHTKTVQIDRGANSGRSETFTNVVRAIRRIGEWRGAAKHFDVLELKGDDEGYVVLVQSGPPEKPGAILAAGKTPGL